MSTKDEKTQKKPDPEELKKQQAEMMEVAKKQLDLVIVQRKPKNLGQGFSTGMNNVLAGAVGGAGIMVVAPVAGFAVGTKKGGIIGGALVGGAGAVVGAVGGGGLMVAGAAAGTKQMVQGVAAVPGQVKGPRSGKRWDEIDGKWVETNLEQEAENLKQIPDDDSDILTVVEPAPTSEKKEVKDTYYYDILGVEPDADMGLINLKYLKLAREHHPDVHKDDPEKAEQFKEISHAYQILSDKARRELYDAEGKAAFTDEKLAVETADPALFFAYLFGSDKFRDYVGRLASASSAMTGNDAAHITIEQARTLQKRRCTRLAILLAEKIDPYGIKVVDEHNTVDTKKITIMKWKEEAEELSKASFGSDMLHLIGHVYCLSAVEFLGARDSGIGMPSISDYAAAANAEMERKKLKTKAEMESNMADMKRIQGEVAGADAPSVAQIVHTMYTKTVVDITATIHETCQMVLFDQSVDVNKRKERAHAIKALGTAFTDVPLEKLDEQNEDALLQLYREAAFAAMIETVRHRDEHIYPTSSTAQQEAGGGEIVPASKPAEEVESPSQ